MTAHEEWCARPTATIISSTSYLTLADIPADAVIGVVTVAEL